MAKKKAVKQTEVNITPLFQKGPKVVMQALKSTVEGLNFTKVIQTYVMEDNSLKVGVVNNKKNAFAGVVKWIGNREDNLEGTVICATSGKDYQMLIPTEDNVEAITVDPLKKLIKIVASEKTKCSVCGNGLSIFDEILACPLCGSKAHKDHLQEWIKMKHSCPICKKALALDDNNNPVPMD